MSDKHAPSTSRNSLGGLNALVPQNGEATQRFSTLQQQLLSAAVHFFHRHIRSDPDVLQRMEGNQMFRLFFEVQYHVNKPELPKIYSESVHDCSALHVCSFILRILHQGIFSVSAFIVSVIYLSRFKESSRITLHACTWRPLFLTSLLLADKMWEDKPVRNSSLAKLFPVLSNVELNKMESEFLGEIRFNVLVKPDLFCSFCEKLLAEPVLAEITRCVNASEYAQTLQADDADAVPLKPIMKQAGVCSKAAPQPEQQQPAESQKHPNGDAEDQSRFDGRFDPVPRNGPRQQPSHVLAWTDGAPLAGANVSSTNLWADPNASVPRSQSAGPTTSHSSRCSSKSRMGPAPPAQPHHSVPPLQLAQRAVPDGAGASGPSSSKASGTPHAPRSASVHPLHRTESQKKPTINKGGEDGEKSARPGPQQAPGHSGPPLRRSLPAKTSQYASLSRTGVYGAQGGEGRSRPPGNAGPGCSSPSGVAVSSFAMSGNTPSLHQLQPTSPRSPGSISPLLVPPEQEAHTSAPHAPGLARPRVTSAPAGPGRCGAVSPNASQGPSQHGQRIITPPVPFGAGGSGNLAAHAISLASHSGPTGGQSSLSKAQQHPRGTASHQGALQHYAAAAAAASGQPARASSAPRVSGIPGMQRSQVNVSASRGLQTQSAADGAVDEEAGSASVRSAGSQSVQSHPSGFQPRLGGVQAPSSPSLNSPVAPGPHVSSAATPAVPPHFGGAPAGSGPTTSGASMVAPRVMFPTSPTVRGSSPAPPVMTSSSLQAKAGRGTIGTTSGLQRNASPMGVATLATAAGRALSPAGNMQMGSVSVSQRTDLLATARGRSPPPAGASRRHGEAEMAPGQLMKGMSGAGTPGLQRSSFGTRVVHRGLG